LDETGNVLRRSVVVDVEVVVIWILSVIHYPTLFCSRLFATTMFMCV